MNTLRALIALPFVLAGLALRILFLPALMCLIVGFIAGFDSAWFGYALLFGIGWVYLEYKTLRGIAHYGRRGRRLH